MSMTKRKCLILAGIVFCSLAGLGVYLLTPPKPGVTQGNFSRLHKGMTREKVEAILGSKGRKKLVLTGVVVYQWKGREGEITIGVGGQGVTGGQFLGGGNEEPVDLADDPGLLALVCRWLGFLDYY